MTDALDADVARVWALLFEIVLDGEKRLAAHFAARGLTTPQFYVLKTLLERDGRCSIGMLARLHGLTNATMSGLINRLEAQGLVMRQPDTNDRRTIHVLLTDAGRAAFDSVQASLHEYVHAVFGLLSAEERQNVITYLSRYVDLIVRGMPLHT